MRFGMTLALVSMFVPASLASAATINIYAMNGPDNELLSFQMVDGGVPVQTGTITSGLNSPNKMAVSPNAELFVVNSGADNIRRYVGADGTLTPNTTYPTIADSNAPDGFNFNNPNGAAFRNNELFVVNVGSADVLRFNFDGSGSPSANLPSTSITTITGSRARALGFSPSGDRMYVSGCCSSSEVMEVYSVDGSGTTALLNTLTTTNFSAAGVTIDNSQGLTVSNTGELWLADTGSSDATGEIVRAVLDAGGNISTASTAIPGSHANLFRPQGLFFSDDGELFTSNIGESATSDDGFLSRFTFDGSGSILTSSQFGPAGDFGSILLVTVPPPVPEPSSLLLLGMGTCFFLRNARRRHRS